MLIDPSYNTNKFNIILAVVLFLLATGITMFFIERSSLYQSREQKILSVGIAGAKWLVQIIAAIFLLKQRWLFIRKIATTCFIGALVLLPYCIFTTRESSHHKFFIMSLIGSVICMMLHYKRSLVSAGVPIGWWYSWLFCLAIAITLQLTIVFHVI